MTVHVLFMFSSNRRIQKLKKRVSNRYAPYYLMSGLVAFILSWSDRIRHIMCSSTLTNRLYIPENHRRFKVLNIGRQLHTVIVCLLDHDVLYVKVANALAIEWNIFCTTYSQVNKRWIIGGSRKIKGSL